MFTEFIAVDSSVIRAVGWENGTLMVELVNGKIYPYSKVPYEVFDGFVHASSPGRYYNENIRGKYQ